MSGPVDGNTWTIGDRVRVVVFATLPVGRVEQVHGALVYVRPDDQPKILLIVGQGDVVKED